MSEGLLSPKAGPGRKTKGFGGGSSKSLLLHPGKSAPLGRKSKSRASTLASRKSRRQSGGVGAGVGLGGYRRLFDSKNLHPKI